MIFSDLSIVVQGPVIEGITERCLKQLRKIAPGAQIILSSWEGSCVDNLEFDDLVLSCDPGSNIDCYTDNPDNLSKPNNHNRQIISVNAGLSLAKRAYTLKFRTDFILNSRFIFEFYDKACNVLQDYEDSFRIFEQRILVFGTGNPRTMKLAFHLADYVLLGYTRDMKKLWDIELSTDEELNYFRQKNISRAPHYFNFRLCNEQSIWISALRKQSKKLHYPRYYYEINDDIVFDSERSLVNNFVFIDYYICDISSKFHWMSDVDNDFSYRFSDYIKLYSLYFGLNNKQKKFNLWYKIKLNTTNYQVISKKINSLSFKKTADCIASVSLMALNKMRHFLSIPLGVLLPLVTLRKKILIEGDRPEYNSTNKIYWIDEKGHKIQVENIPGFEIRFGGHSNIVYVNSRGLMFGNAIYIDGSNNSLYIGRNVHCISHVTFFIGNGYNNRALSIGKNAMLMGGRIFLEEDNNYINVGDNLTCSDDVIIQSSDGHVIIDENMSTNNARKGIDIGDNVWLGRRSTILKGVTIASGSVLAACSVATKQYEKNNVIIAGNPAKIIRENIKWTRDMFNQFDFSDI